MIIGNQSWVKCFKNHWNTRQSAYSVNIPIRPHWIFVTTALTYFITILNRRVWPFASFLLDLAPGVVRALFCIWYPQWNFKVLVNIVTFFTVLAGCLRFFVVAAKSFSNFDSRNIRIKGATSIPLVPSRPGKLDTLTAFFSIIRLTVAKSRIGIAYFCFRITSSTFTVWGCVVWLPF